MSPYSVNHPKYRVSALHVPSMKPLGILVGVALVSLLTSGVPLANGQNTKLSQCGGDVTGDSDSLTYPTPGESLQPGDICVWTIHLETMTNFRFVVQNLDLASNYTDCRDGSLRLYSLSNKLPAGEPETTSYCNNQPPPGVLFVGESVAVVILYVSEDNGRPGMGFNLSWTATNSDPVQTKHVTSFTTVPQGIIKYPVAGNYETNLAATWLIKTVTLQQTTRSDFSLNALTFGFCSNPSPCLCDALILYEITEAGFLNETERFCGDTSNAFISNIGSRFIVAFFTDGQTDSEDRGFEVAYVPTDAITTTVLTSTTSTTTTTTTTMAPIPDTPCGSIFSETITGRISYKPSELYQSNERCVWTIRIQNAVGITFNLIQSGLGSDPDDGLSVSTFTRADPPLQGTVFMKEQGLPISMRGSLAIVTFISDASTEGMGFVLEYRATDFYTGNISALSTDFISTTPLGYMDYPDGDGTQYDNRELSSFVITTPDFSVDNSPRLNTTWTSRGLGSSCYDVVVMYKFYPDPNNSGGWSQYDLYCATSPKMTSHTDILLFIFKTDTSGTYDGFSLEWITA